MNGVADLYKAIDSHIGRNQDHKEGLGLMHIGRVNSDMTLRCEDIEYDYKPSEYLVLENMNFREMVYEGTCEHTRRIYQKKRLTPGDNYLVLFKGDPVVPIVIDRLIRASEVKDG